MSTQGARQQLGIVSQASPTSDTVLSGSRKHTTSAISPKRVLPPPVAQRVSFPLLILPLLFLSSDGQRLSVSDRRRQVGVKHHPNLARGVEAWMLLLRSWTFCAFGWQFAISSVRSRGVYGFRLTSNCLPSRACTQPFFRIPAYCEDLDLRLLASFEESLAEVESVRGYAPEHSATLSWFGEVRYVSLAEGFTQPNQQVWITARKGGGSVPSRKPANPSGRV